VDGNDGRHSQKFSSSRTRKTTLSSLGGSWGEMDSLYLATRGDGIRMRCALQGFRPDVVPL